MKWYSFLSLAGLNLLIFIQTAIQLSVSALQPYMTLVYPNLSAFGAVAPSLVFLIVFLPVGLFTATINKYVPLIWTLTAASALTLIGSVLRYFLVQGYGFFITGTILVALAQPFIINNQSLLSQYLVSPHYQGTFNGFVSMIGGAAGALGWLAIPAFVVDAKSAVYYLPILELCCLGLEGLATLCFALVFAGLGMDKGKKGKKQDSDAEKVFFQTKKPRNLRYCKLGNKPGQHPLLATVATTTAPPEVDQPLRVARFLTLYGAVQGGLQSVSNLLNNLLQIMMFNSTIAYTSWDIFLAGLCFFVPVVPFPFLMGLLIDKLEAWGKFSLSLTVVNLFTTAGILYTVNVNKILFLVFVTLYSLTSGTIVTACLATANVLLDHIDDPKADTASSADGNSDQINSALNWVTAILNFVTLLIATYISVANLNILLIVLSAILTAAAITLLVRLPKWSEV